jgi:hypothetical protein
VSRVAGSGNGDFGEAGASRYGSKLGRGSGWVRGVGALIRSPISGAGLAPWGGGTQLEFVR